MRLKFPNDESKMKRIPKIKQNPPAGLRNDITRPIAVPTHESPKKRARRVGSHYEVGNLPNDYFVPLHPFNFLMGLILSLLLFCAFDPEDCALIPSYESSVQFQGWIAGCLFLSVLLVNFVMTLLVIKICEKNQLTSITTSKWIGQTLISGILSWEVLKVADEMMSVADTLLNR